MSRWPQWSGRGANWAIAGSGARQTIEVRKAPYDATIPIGALRPEMVVEVSYVEMTPDGLLLHVVYLGERENKPARDVHRERPE